MVKAVHLKSNKRSLLAYFLYVAVFFLTLWVVNGVIRRLELPTYGVWTGNVPLENKLRLLREFAAAGPVDAVVMGSSFADHGFSAKTFSDEMSRASQRPMRIFNMATGAGDWQMFPILYRLTRLYANPKQLYILHPVNTGTGGGHLRDETPWPDGQFMRSHAGKFLRSPELFKLSASLWMTSLINDSGAARDLFLHGYQRNAPSSSLLNYPANEYGDKISHLFMHSTKGLDDYRAQLQQTVNKSAALYQSKTEQHDCAAVNPFFSADDLSAINELHTLLRQDGVKLTLVAQDSPAAYGIKSLDFRDAQRVYYEVAIRECVKPDQLVFPVDFVPERYEAEDIQHMNIHAARRFAKSTSDAILNKPVPPHIPRAFYAQDTYPSGIEFHHLVGVVLSGQSSEKKIDVDYYTFNVAPVDRRTMHRPDVLRLELVDAEGNVHVGKGVASDGNRISFVFDSLPGQSTAFLARLIEINADGNKHHLIAPIRSYTWMH